MKSSGIGGVRTSPSSDTCRTSSPSGTDKLVLKLTPYIDTYPTVFHRSHIQIDGVI